MDRCQVLEDKMLWYMDYSAMENVCCGTWIIVPWRMYVEDTCSE